jgi:hypothetical protein
MRRYRNQLQAPDRAPAAVGASDRAGRAVLHELRALGASFPCLAGRPGPHTRGIRVQPR